MAKMPLTVVAHNLNTGAISIWHSQYFSLYLIVEAGPSTVADEFHVRLVKWREALAADVEALIFGKSVATFPRSFSPFVYYYTSLLFV